MFVKLILITLLSRYQVNAESTMTKLKAPLIPSSFLNCNDNATFSDAYKGYIKDGKAVIIDRAKDSLLYSDHESDSAYKAIKLVIKSKHIIVIYSDETNLKFYLYRISDKRWNSK